MRILARFSVPHTPVVSLTTQSEFWQQLSVQVVLSVAILAALIAMGLYIIQRVRSNLHDARPSTSELLSKFRDLHSKGELNDEEFRTIKSTLGARLRDELKRNDEAG